MFIKGTVEYSADLPQVTLATTTFTGRDPVTDIEVSSDGTKARIVVHLGPVESEPAALEAATEDVHRVWAAILLGLPAEVTTATTPRRERVEMEEPPREGHVALRAAVGVSVAGNAVIAVSPGLEARQRVIGMAQASGWDPSASAAYTRYAEALREPDPAVQLLGLYGAAIEAFTPPGGGAERREAVQRALDAELWRFDPSIPKLPLEPGAKAEETPFTRARNRLLHPVDRRVTLQEARSYAAGQVGEFRKVVATVVGRTCGAL